LSRAGNFQARLDDTHRCDSHACAQQRQTIQLLIAWEVHTGGWRASLAWEPCLTRELVDEVTTASCLKRSLPVHDRASTRPCYKPSWGTSFARLCNFVGEDEREDGWWRREDLALIGEVNCGDMGANGSTSGRWEAFLMQPTLRSRCVACHCPLGIVVLALACMRVHQAAQEGEVTVGLSRWHCDCEVAKCSAFCAHFRTLVLS
jgi:hypothetical protein